MTDAYPSHVRIVEMGPRDGLQNESMSLSVETKVELVERLARTGLTKIEAGSFVSPKWVPQMANSGEVFAQLRPQVGVTYSALTPNMQGLDAALAAGVKEVAVFGAASEAFSQKNINCSIAQSIERFIPVIEKARHLGVPVRGYVSCVLGCPYQGDVPIDDVVQVASTLHQLGCYEISLGDTIGVGTPLNTAKLLTQLSKVVPTDKLAVHFHDTYGQALANILMALQHGITVVDSAVGGLGGCPYAKGASGNVATEDVVYMLNGMGIETGVDIEQLMPITQWICAHLNKSSQSKVTLAAGGI